jgi:hypothetical protein
MNYLRGDKQRAEPAAVQAGEATRRPNNPLKRSPLLLQTGRQRNLQLEGVY